MAALIICSDFGAPKNEVCHYFCCFPICLLWSDGTRSHDLQMLHLFKKKKWHICAFFLLITGEYWLLEAIYSSTLYKFTFFFLVSSLKMVNTKKILTCTLCIMAFNLQIISNEAVLIYLSHFSFVFPGDSDSKESTWNAGDLSSIPGMPRSLEKGVATHSNISAWRIPMNRGAWQATVHGVPKSQTQLSD